MQHKTIDVQALSPQARCDLADDIFPIYRKIFHGWSTEKIRNLLLDQGCCTYKVRIFLSDAGEPIGFAWLNGRRVAHQGRWYTVFHTMGGLDGAARKGGLITSFFTKEMVRYRLTHPTHRIYCAQRIIHPLGYRAWVRALHRLYPHREVPASPFIQGLSDRLLQVFNYQAVDRGNPFVVQTDNQVSLSAEDRRHWQKSRDPDVAFYRRLTGGMDGHAVMMVFPLGFKDLSLSVLKGVSKGFRRRLGA